MSFLSSTATRERATRPSRFIRDPEPAPHARDRRAPADRADAARDASTARAERGGESPARPAGLPLLPLLVLAAVGFVSVTTELLPAGLLPEIAAEFRVGESTAGFLTAGYAGIIVVSVIPLVALTARLPRRPLLLAGLVAFVASNILLALSPNFEVAVGARMVGGAAHGLVWALMAPYVARIVAPERVGRAMAIVFAGNSIGAAAGAPVATALGGALGWRAGFLALALPLAVLAVLVLLVVPPSPGLGRSESRSVVAAVRRPGVAAITVAFPLLLLAHFTVLTYIAPFLAQRHVPDAATSASLSLIGVAGLVGIWAAGVTVDSVPRRSLLRATAVLVAAFAALALVHNVVAVLAFIALWGGSFAATAVYNQAAILNAAGPLKDAATSVIVVATQLGIALGAVYGGFALGTAGVGAVPLAAALPAGVSLAIVVLARRAAYPPGPGERDQAARHDDAGAARPVARRAARQRAAAERPQPVR